MAAAGLLALLDDITTLLDDVATMSKVAVKKTSGVVGDDLALNAQQVVGFSPDRELPVVWAVAKGSLLNKVILVPAALLISATVPAAIGPLLMVGGAFLCYEGVEKVWHKLRQAPEEAHHLEELRAAATASAADLLALERTRIRGAIRTDFILSAEIVVIALGTMTSASVPQQAAALSAIGVLVTLLVYGLVAGIVKLDDLGLRLIALGGAARTFGRGILRSAPWLLRGLGIAGTIAMFLVGGSILAHGIPAVGHGIEAFTAGRGGAGTLLAMALEAGFGIIVGGLVLSGLALMRRLTGTPAPAAS
jgi:predicted DNA repair protein MutK